MSPYEVCAVTVADAPGIAKNNMSAFYEDVHWRLVWQDNPLSNLIKGATDRYPHNITQNRATKRHQKAIDSSTGELVGYARWVLPEGYENLWPEAQLDELSEEEREKCRKLYEEAWWEMREDLGPDDDEIRAARDEIRAGGKFMSKHVHFYCPISV